MMTPRVEAVSPVELSSAAVVYPAKAEVEAL
jgi:hypothetical protein